VDSETEHSLLKRADDILEKTLYYLAAALLMTIAGTVIYAVMLRYVFNNPPLWAEEAPRVFFLWMTYLGIAVATKRGQNIRVTHFIDKFRQGPRAILEIFMHILVLIMLVTLLWFNIPVLKLQSGGVMISNQWSYLWPFSALSVGCVLMFLYQTKLLLGSIRSYREVYGKGS
jgi:TRAP-type transport system small permease protein